MMLHSEGVSSSPSRRRSPSPSRRRARSPSPSRRRARSPSPRRRARSPSPRRRARSPSPNRKGAISQSQIRKAGHSSSPTRNGIVSVSQTGTHSLERFAKLNFSKSVKRHSIVKSNSNSEAWQYTTDPIQRPLLKHLISNQHLSSLACAAFKDILLFCCLITPCIENLRWKLVLTTLPYSMLARFVRKNNMFLDWNMFIAKKLSCEQHHPST